MKKVNIAYWILTGLLALFIIFTAIPDIMVTPDAVNVISTQLRYPEYFIPFIGVAKVLGAIAILIPGYPRLKEWAYAGLAFDIAGAFYSSLAVGEPLMPVVPFFILILGVLAASYILYHKRQRLKQVA